MKKKKTSYSQKANAKCHILDCPEMFIPFTCNPDSKPHQQFGRMTPILIILAAFRVCNWFYDAIFERVNSIIHCVIFTSYPVTHSHIDTRKTQRGPSQPYAHDDCVHTFSATQSRRHALCTIKATASSADTFICVCAVATIQTHAPERVATDQHTS